MSRFFDRNGYIDQEKFLNALYEYWDALPVPPGIPSSYDLMIEEPCYSIERFGEPVANGDLHFRNFFASAVRHYNSGIAIRDESELSGETLKVAAYLKTQEGSALSEEEQMHMIFRALMDDYAGPDAGADLYQILHYEDGCELPSPARPAANPGQMAKQLTKQ